MAPVISLEVGWYSVVTSPEIRCLNTGISVMIQNTKQKYVTI